MTTYKIDQGTNFGTWEDTTSRLLYDDAIYPNYMMELLETYDELNDIPFSNIKNLI